jgi:hypothetical protein
VKKLTARKKTDKAILSISKRTAKAEPKRKPTLVTGEIVIFTP